MVVIDTNKFGLTIYFEAIKPSGGFCSITDGDYETLATDIFGHSKAYSIQEAREERRRLTKQLKERGVKSIPRTTAPVNLTLK